MNTSTYNPNKERFKIAAIAETILENDFDVVGLCEIGGIETLKNFNKHYLDDRYDCHLYEENSRRGIFVGAMLKRGVFSRVAAKNVRGTFSRNVLELSLYRGTARLRMYVVHLKSQHGQDRGIEQRLKEVAQLSALVPRRKCVVMGDFNGILARGGHQFEFEEFLALPFRDVLEAMDIPERARFSHFYFRDGLNFSQLDYIFVSNDLAVTGGGMLGDMVPLNYEQRRRLPSDHIFITATIELPGAICR
jgi:endonuclease/exonuclease/phosphatase family metal-dependent hydrolase